ncbi:MAG TPA: sulfatase [Candidatus Limnocylindria bacterium]|nr:sulfatase [Candidatus Limnocylindria bacterium]
MLLVVADTLRADRLGAYGNRRGLTPFLDELAARGWVARRARAQASWTNPSVASILTSRYQSQHGIVDFASVLPSAELTLAEVLQSAGYATAAFSANGLIGATNGFAQGFDRFEAHLLAHDDAPAYLRVPVRTDRLAADALAWLDGVWREAPATPVFLYVQPMEPHSPYAPPPDVLARVRGAKPPVDLRRASETMFIDATNPVDHEQLDEILDAYNASVAAMDAALAELFAALEARGFFDQAVVVVTADHGEEFQEHGARGHGRTLFDETIHVPLIIVPPGDGGPGVVEHLVSSIDIAPTILELAGVPVPARFAGRSFASSLQGGIGGRVRRALVSWRGDPSQPASYSEHLRPPGEAVAPATSHQRALVVDDLKLIGWRDGARRFYDLRVDPGEHAPNTVEDADRARLEAALAEMEARARLDASPPETRAPDARTLQALEALGYVQ